MSDTAKVLGVKARWVRIVRLVLVRLHLGVVRTGDGFDGQCDVSSPESGLDPTELRAATA